MNKDSVTYQHRKNLHAYNWNPRKRAERKLNEKKIFEAIMAENNPNLVGKKPYTYRKFSG